MAFTVCQRSKEKNLLSRLSSYLSAATAVIVALPLAFCLPNLLQQSEARRCLLADHTCRIEPHSIPAFFQGYSRGMILSTIEDFSSRCQTMYAFFVRLSSMSPNQDPSSVSDQKESHHVASTHAQHPSFASTMHVYAADSGRPRVFRRHPDVLLIYEKRGESLSFDSAFRSAFTDFFGVVVFFSDVLSCIAFSSNLTAERV